MPRPAKKPQSLDQNFGKGAPGDNDFPLSKVTLLKIAKELGRATVTILEGKAGNPLPK